MGVKNLEDMDITMDSVLTVAHDCGGTRLEDAARVSTWLLWSKGYEQYHERPTISDKSTVVYSASIGRADLLLPDTTSTCGELFEAIEKQVYKTAEKMEAASPISQIAAQFEDDFEMDR